MDRPDFNNTGEVRGWLAEVRGVLDDLAGDARQRRGGYDAAAAECSQIDRPERGLRHATRAFAEQHVAAAAERANSAVLALERATGDRDWMRGKVDAFEELVQPDPEGSTR